MEKVESRNLTLVRLFVASSFVGHSETQLDKINVYFNEASAKK